MNDQATNHGIPIWCIATGTWWRQWHSDTCTTYDDGDIVWTMPRGKFRELDIHADGIPTIEHLITVVQFKSGSVRFRSIDYQQRARL